MPTTSIRAFLAELRRRRVYRVAGVYLVLAWGLLQLGDVVIEPLLLPDWTMTLVIVLLALGFPVAVILAWAYDITPDGVRRAEPAPRTISAEMARPSRLASRSAGLVGVGILIGIVGVGWYAYFDDEPARPPIAEASALRAIAVLPFANTSGDADNDFFADGVTDDILTHLAVVPAFSVISRTTAMRYKGSEKSAPEIAGELGVAYVLEGTVRRAGERVRITARLVDGRTDQHIWAETYDRQLRDIFEVQTDIARSIADALEAELSTGVAARIERRPTESLEAYDLFLRGRDNYYRYDREGTERAIESFRAALELDPEFTLATAWLSRAYAIYGFNHGGGSPFGDSARAIGRRAVAAQPDLPDAHTALGTALATSGRYDEAVPALERAAELNPNDWASIANLGLVYSIVGRQDEAIRLTRRSLERDPARSFLAYGNLGSYYAQLLLMDEARVALARSLELNPAFLQSTFWIGFIDWYEGRFEDARAAAEHIDAAGEPRWLLDGGFLFVLLGDLPRARSALERAYAALPGASGSYLLGVPYAFSLQRTGDEELASRIMAETEDHIRARMAGGDESRNLAYSLAGIEAMRGNHEAALDWLEDAVDRGWRVVAMSRDPILASLHSSERYHAIVQRAQAELAVMAARVRSEGL
jgi:adenylate cyclase